jgi:hypothetical protein
VRQGQGVAGEDEREDRRDQEDPPHLLGAGVGAQQEDEGPADQHPADRAPHAHRAEIGRRVAQVGEGDRIGHRQGGHIDQAEDQVAGEERPEAGRQRRPDQGQAADQVADRQEPLGREIAIGELVGEEDSDHRGHAPRAADQ